MFTIRTIESNGDSIRLIPDYSGRDMDWLRTTHSLAERFKNQNRDTATIKKTIDASMEDNKEIQKEIEKISVDSINTFESDEKHKLQYLLGYRTKIKKIKYRNA